MRFEIICADCILVHELLRRSEYLEWTNERLENVAIAMHCNLKPVVLDFKYTRPVMHQTYRFSSSAMDVSAMPPRFPVYCTEILDILSSVSIVSNNLFRSADNRPFWRQVFCRQSIAVGVESQSSPSLSLDSGPCLSHVDFCVILLQFVWLLCNLFYS